jgi:hypothetical protein
MTLNSRSVMGRVRPRSVSHSNTAAKDNRRDPSKLVLPVEKPLHVLDYWEELLGSPDDAYRSGGSDTKTGEA